LKGFLEVFLGDMESINKIGKEFFARCRKSCTSDTEKLFYFLFIVHFFFLKIENIGIYFWGWDEVIFRYETYFLDGFACKLKSEREIGIIISFFLANLVAYFLLHKNYHFLWLIFQFMKKPKKDGGSDIIRNIGDDGIGRKFLWFMYIFSWYIF